jgi:hypothetical protein
MSEVDCLSCLVEKLFNDDFSPAIVTAVVEDTPDLGFRNRRFQSVPFRFKKGSIYERKTRFLTISSEFMTDE